ncbi:hypothetical protein KC19_12G114500 [Ceratodon purpureus]|uniref:Uncharacterized protein n=1 Tax=Ceratodon purpureus TaxID=3225 RepID=A0A8T0G636_CERPU|nr:hypothetical protein KC19_12G114500 [Ceratodon purpureus]
MEMDLLQCLHLLRSCKLTSTGFPLGTHCMCTLTERMMCLLTSGFLKRSSLPKTGGRRSMFNMLERSQSVDVTEYFYILEIYGYLDVRSP